VGMLDPVVMISAMASVTKSVSFGITGSTTYLPVGILSPTAIIKNFRLTREQPYLLARTWGTLDHMTKGRVAWNVVTSYGSKSADAVGYTKVVPHDKRYAEADEFMEIVYS
jgi:alkanesulfonate monooxygenase SsuD/methylene tetrahydromethanopterin reductase-like flavin-dependent oxidoreductase (luciferase family)